jgi:DNA topoisomerase-2
MVLVNGALGIGTGFSTNIPQHTPSDIIKCCMALIEGIDTNMTKSERSLDTDEALFQACSIIDNVELPQLVPWYLGYTGSITMQSHKEGSFVSKGVYRWVDDTTLEITELPVGTWTDDYKEMLQNMIQSQSQVLKDFESHYTARSVRFLLKLYPGVRTKIDVETDFKLASTKNLSLNNIHLYGENGAIKKYKDTIEVLKEWAYTRLEKYKKRKEHQLCSMEKAYIVVSAKVRFIQDVIDNKIKIMNRKMKDVEAQLHDAKYPTLSISDSDGTGTGPEESGSGSGSNYNYLTRMPINQLTFEKKQSLEKEASDIHMKMEKLKATPIHHIWRSELTELSEAWEAHREEMEASYKADRENRVTPSQSSKGKGKK